MTQTAIEDVLGTADLAAGAAAAAARTADLLLSMQGDPGWWQGELVTNVSIEAEDLLLRQFLGIRTDELTAQTARWIRQRQRADGTWANYPGGPAELSTTVEAYVALRLAGDSPEAAHLTAARRYILGAGGIEATRVFTRIWLALLGVGSWDDLPVMPPELILLPPAVPLNVYDWACWARQTIVPLTILCALRPARPLGVEVGELWSGRRPDHRASLRTPAGRFQRLDAALHRYERRPLRWLRRAALHRAVEWIVRRQEADGSWGGIQPPWVYSLLALHAIGYPLDHPVLRAGLAGLDRFTVRERSAAGPVRRLEACQSPVWDTALAMVALGDAGLPADCPALRRGADWLLAEEVRRAGDWAVRRPTVAPGGWAFEFDNDGYPDVDDTAEVLLALERAPASPRRGAATERAVSWLLGMQCSDGGWAAFDADNTRSLCTQLPFCDFGAVIDPPTADVTAHVVEALAARGLAESPAVRRGVDWLRRAQESDGSWFGRWGANHVYGTGAVVPALVATGMPPEHPVIGRAVGWLAEHQNPDGGWGEDLRSYRDPAWIGRGASTPSQTAWALLALLAAGDRGRVVDGGVRWLLDAQLDDGSFDEELYTGTGFPGDFYISYRLYRLVFPLTALARYAGRDSGTGRHP